jgi:hypothetical protein
MNARTHPDVRPGLVFSEDAIGSTQEPLLENVYLGAITPATRGAIYASALLRAYASQLLTALVLHVLGTKLHVLLELVTGAFPIGDRDQLKEGIRSLRSLLAANADGDRLAFIEKFVDQSSRARTLFRDGIAGSPKRRYDSLTAVPVQEIPHDPNLPSLGLRELAVALSLLGLGVRQGHWTVDNADPLDGTSGSIAVVTAVNSKVFLVNNDHTAMQLRQNGHLPDGANVVVVFSQTTAPRMARSPDGVFGRTAKVQNRDVSIAKLLQGATGANDLLQAFRLESAL